MGEPDAARQDDAEDALATLTHIHFDCFGTLVDYSNRHRGDSHEGSHGLLSRSGCELSYEDYLVLWQSTFEEFVQKSTASLEEFSMDDLCLHFLSTHLPSVPETHEVSAFRDAYLEEWTRGVSYIPGLNTMLDGLASRYRLGVVSNTHHAPLVTGILERAGIAEYFSDVTTSVEHGRRKPCPTIYQHALAISGGRPAGSVFVGDSFIHDYAGPRAVGMQALLIDPLAVETVPDAHRLRTILDLGKRIAD